VTAELLAEVLRWDEYQLNDFRLSVGSLFSAGKDRIEPFHTSVMNWLADSNRAGAYLVSEAAGHRRLADHGWQQYQRGAATMSRYMLAHLPAHLRHTSRWDDLAALLTDLRFVEAKCTPGMTYELVGDYAAAESAGAPVEVLRTLQPFAQFVRGRSHVLVHHPELTLQEAYNLAASGPVPEQAERLLAQSARPWLRLVNRPAAGSGQCLQTLEGHTDRVSAVALTPDGKRAISGSGDKTVRVWDLETGQCLHTLEGHSGRVGLVAVASDGQRVVTCDGDRVRLWDVGSGQCLRALDENSGAVPGLMGGLEKQQSVPSDTSVPAAARDMQKRRDLYTAAGLTFKITATATTPDGKVLVAGSGGDVWVWDLERGEHLRTMEGHVGRVGALAVTPDGKRVVSGESWPPRRRGAWKNRAAAVKVWEVESGECLWTLEGHEDDVDAVVVTPDGKWAVTGSEDHTGRVWDLERGACACVLEGHLSRIWAVAVTPDGGRAVTGSDDGTVKVWDLWWRQGSDARERRAGGVLAVAITPEGRRAVTAGWDETVKVWDLGRGRSLLTLEGHRGEVNGVAAMPDGRRVISGGWDRTVRLWDIARGECAWTSPRHGSPVYSVAVTPDGHRAIVGGSDGEVQVWDLERKEPVWALRGHTDSVCAVALSPDGRQAATHSYDGMVRIWDLERGVCRLTLEARRAQALDLAAVPDGNGLIVGSQDGIVQVWEMGRGECLRILRGHTSNVCGVATMPDGRHVVTASWDRTVRVWEVGTGAEVAMFCADAGVVACAAIPGSAEVAFVDEKSRIHWLALEKVEAGPPILTPWCSPLDRTFAFGCPLCRAWSEVPDSALGAELPCPHCGNPVKLNPFTIEADWRPVAEAWRPGEAGQGSG
jgi:WD40 repeat protein